MVFSKLSAQEKEAFFGLLDEYFQSRPEIFAQNTDDHGAGGLAGTGISTAAAASVVQRAIAANNPTSGPRPSTVKSNNPYAASIPTTLPSNVDVTQAMSVGRVAAASLAFSGRGGGGGGGPSQPTSSVASIVARPPSLAPLLPRRGQDTSANANANDGSTPGIEVDKLVTAKGSMLSAFKKSQATGAGVTIPSAFGPPKSAFAPPPVRRVTSETGSSSSAGTANGNGGVMVQRMVPPRAQVQSEPEPEEEQGEWAEVLYDYNSEDPADLTIEAGMRVLVTAKSSPDWWTGQADGREGLFPASYVKLL